MQIRLDPYYANAITELRRSTSVVRTMRSVLTKAPISRPRKSFSIYKFDTLVPIPMEQTLAQSDITIRPGSQADLTRMEGMETWRDIDVYRDWLARGRHLLIAEERGEIVSYSWQDFGEQFVIEQVPELRYRLSEDACYGDESYTPVAHRGRGLRRLLFVAERQLARARGRRFVVAYFMSKRAAEDALRNFERLGVPRGVALHEVVLWNFGGLRIASARALAEDRTIRCLD